jgi:hypothetical protein
MKKILLGMIAAFALTSFGVARAEDAPAADAKPAKEKKGKKKADKKDEKKDEAPAK